MKKNYIPVFIFGFFLIIFALLLADSFILKTDQSIIGELFTHKLAGIALLALAVFFLHYKWADIGFKKVQLLRGILKGITIGGSAFIVAYVLEIIMAAIQGKTPTLQFYITSYNITGNTQLNSGILFILVCIIGNIINVIMENGIFSGLFITTAEKRYSFAKANVFSSLLFGFWHTVMPIRNYIDGEQSLMGMIMTIILLFCTSFIFSVMLGMQYKQASSLWDGMTVHFINNASVNMFHVVFANAETGAGTESNPTMRIAIAQTIMFIIVLVRWFMWKKQKINILEGKNVK
ncbi:MAG: CPBP family intramembrane metalloprotease [Treponema sp.]|nr:CPBP family intramembrane metalloprotease [Treponema sp.]